MNICLFFGLAIFVSRMRASEVERKASILTIGEVAAMVKAHNERRSKVRPAGSDIRVITWDSNLADHAQAYSEKCVFRHSAKYIFEPYGSIGENIFITTRPMIKSDDITWSVTAWYNERLDYDFGRNFCKPNKMCGHYTQLVWDKSHKIGCGKTKCQGNVRVGTDTYVKPTIIVCKYGPSGNVKPLFSNKARRPYKEGSWCRDCPEEASLCDGRLCTPKLLYKEITKPDARTNCSVIMTSTNTASELTTIPQNMPSGKPEKRNEPSGTPVLVLQTGTVPTKAGRLTTSVFAVLASTLRCKVCEGQPTAEACSRQNKSMICSESQFSEEGIPYSDEPWYCASYKEKQLIKMSCMKLNECNRLVAADADVKCCNEDLCNTASVPVYSFLILFLPAVLIYTIWIKPNELLL